MRSFSFGTQEYFLQLEQHDTSLPFYQDLSDTAIVCSIRYSWNGKVVDYIVGEKSLDDPYTFVIAETRSVSLRDRIALAAALKFLNDFKQNKNA